MLNNITEDEPKLLLPMSARPDDSRELLVVSRSAGGSVAGYGDRQQEFCQQTLSGGINVQDETSLIPENVDFILWGLRLVDLSPIYLEYNAFSL